MPCDSNGPLKTSRDINDGNYDFSSWNTFEHRFRETFGNPHLVDEARRKLWTVRQGSRTSEDFFLEFEEIRLEADICENSVVMFLQAALRPSILQEVLRRDPPPVSYIDWKTASLCADHNQRSSAATKSFHQHSFPPQPRQNTFLPFRSRFNFNNQPSTSTSHSTTSVPHTTTTPANHTQLDYKSRAPTTGHHLSVNKPTTKNKNCWKCGKEGHFSNNCPDNAPNLKVRALFEQCEELDAAYEAASTGADFIRKLVESPTDDFDDDECRAVLERFVCDHPVFVNHDK
jgi:hypothetical protein